MNSNPPKKQPTTAINEPQDLELEDQIRLRAYELYEERGREDGHERGRLAPRERRDQHQEMPNRHRLIVHTPSQKVRQAPDTLRGFFHAPKLSHRSDRPT